MATIDVQTPAGTAAGTVELPAEVFDVQVNVPLIHQVVVGQLAAARQGTADTKNRGEVRGGGRKPYKQKGTGRARQGSTRAPQFTGGGVVHGPSPRSYEQRTPKKMKAAALRGALSDRARNGRVHVISAVVDGDLPSTRAAVATLAALTDRRNVLVVVERADAVGWKSLRNVAGVHLLVVDQLNTYDVLCSDDVVFTRGALEEFLAGPTATKAPRPVPAAAAAPVRAAAAQAGAAISAAATAVADRAAEVTEEVADKVADVREEIAEEIAEAREEVAELREEVAEKVAEAREEVAEKVAEIREEVAEKVAEARRAVAKRVAGDDKPGSEAAAAADDKDEEAAK